MMFHAILMVLLTIPPTDPCQGKRHPYQHPRLVVYKDGELLFADVDCFGNIVGYREMDPWKPHPLDDPSGKLDTDP